MFQENVMDLIIALTQHVDDSSGYLHQDSLLLLEIFHHILEGRDPELIAGACIKGSKVCFILYPFIYEYNISDMLVICGDF